MSAHAEAHPATEVHEEETTSSWGNRMLIFGLVVIVCLFISLILYVFHYEKGTSSSSTTTATTETKTTVPDVIVTSSTMIKISDYLTKPSSAATFDLPGQGHTFNIDVKCNMNSTDGKVEITAGSSTFILNGNSFEGAPKDAFDKVDVITVRPVTSGAKIIFSRI